MEAESATRWGILATGSIAHTFAQGLAACDDQSLVAVGSRTAEAAHRFGAEFGLAADACHGSYEALLADDRVEAVYISPPHPQHARWAIRAAEAGKHVLCEKPLTMNHADALEVVNAAERHGVLLMEAFMYRCHPQTARLVQLIREGAIGEVCSIQATFSFRSEFNPASRLFDPARGGGGILDVGCYTMSFARLIAGVARSEPFAEPIELSGAAHIGATGVDEWSVASLKFPGDITAQLATGVHLFQPSTASVFGSEGWLHIPNPWAPTRDGGVWRLQLHERGKAEPREIAVETSAHLYSIEARTFSAGIAARKVAHPAMSPADTLGNMAALDRWRAAIGLRYPMEESGSR
jgi:predicted dehydrogenase